MSVDTNILVVGRSSEGEPVIHVGAIKLGREQLKEMETTISARLAYIILQDNLRELYEESSPLAAEPQEMDEIILRVDRTATHRLLLSSERQRVLLEGTDLSAVVTHILRGIWSGSVEGPESMYQKVSNDKRNSRMNADRHQV